MGKPDRLTIGKGSIPIKHYQLVTMLAVVIWGANFASSSIALEVFSSTVLSMLRTVIATIILAIYFFIKKVPLPKLKDLPLFLFSAATGFTFYLVCFNLGMTTLTSATGSVVMALAPVSTALFAQILFKEKIRLGGWIATGICFIGVLILMLWDGVLSINVGIFWMLATVLLVSTYNMCQKMLLKKYTFFQATGYSIIFAAIMLLVFVPESIPQIGQADMRHWLAVLYMGIFPSAVAYLIWGWALSVAEKVSEVTVLFFVQPIFATFFGFILLKEVPTLGVFIGTAVIIFGLFLFNAKK